MEEHDPRTCGDPFCPDCTAYFRRATTASERAPARDTRASSDAVDHPAHYTRTRIEPIDVIEAWELPHHLACVVKYLARYRFKGRPVEDLKKGRWYLDRWIHMLEGES